MRQIGIVGSGPMAIYLLKHLSVSDDRLAISIFEASEAAGLGMPYNSEYNADYMLCNAFSREIPAIERPLLGWLKDRPARELNQWELTAHDLAARAFYPRVLIGEYLQSQFEDLCKSGQEAGHQIRVFTQSCVVDIKTAEDGTPSISYRSGQEGSGQDIQTAQFDFVAIASGHSWPEVPEIDGVAMVSPWPYTNITALTHADIGILGSSLSAIDSVMALGHARGVFDQIGDRISWLPNDADDDLRITMVSHMGIMPEGDFYYPFPYEPLTCLTRAAVDDEIVGGSDGLLDRVFALLCDELDAADPDYLTALPSTARTVEGFAPGYFAHRREMGGLQALKRDLTVVGESLKRKETIPHRYVLLRSHEIFDHVLRDLSEEDYARFLEHLMPVFADCYAAVPHLSLARIVALYDAGVLALIATEERAEFSETDDGMIAVDTEDGTIEFDALIDARGQASAGLKDLPFPELVKALRAPEEPVIRPFALDLARSGTDRIYCLALPQLLERYPFSQGLVECCDLARCVAEDILSG
ncbi:FAD/NAD(P)-binding protein [Parasphingorhabdus sp.]|uniref:FAD/NAD(P)-binding protein n=1 Tax=Parasphingorhabdus sp. TaxID=2709688 RepID=UPI00359360AF